MTLHCQMGGRLLRLLPMALLLAVADCGETGGGPDGGNAAFDYTGQWLQIALTGASICGGKTYVETSHGYSGFDIGKSGSTYTLSFKLRDGSACALSFSDSAGAIAAEPGQKCSYMGNQVTFTQWTLTPSGTQLIAAFETTVKYGGTPVCTPVDFTWGATWVRQ